MAERVTDEIHRDARELTAEAWRERALRAEAQLAEKRGGCGQPGHVTAGGSEGTCWCETCRADDLKDRLAAAEADAAEGRRLALAPCPTEETMGRFFDDLCAWAERKPAERDHVDRDIWEGLVTRHAFERDVYRAVLEDGEYERVDQMPDELGLAGARMLGKLAAERTKALRKKCQLMTEAFAAIMHLYHGMSCDDDRLEWAKIGRRAVELAIAALAEEVKP